MARGKRVREIGLWSGWFTKDIDSQRYPLVRLDRDEVVDGGGSERGRRRRRTGMGRLCGGVWTADNRKLPGYLC